MRFNINEIVRVKLTERGRQVHKDDHAEFWKNVGMPAPTYAPPKEDAEGWSRWQLWALMEAFGSHTSLGVHPCFECDIDIETTHG